MRRKPNLDERTARCAHMLVSDPEALRGRWLDEVHPVGMYTDGSGPDKGRRERLLYDALHIELGCGKGLFTVESAKAEPGTLFVAVEKISNVLVIALERAAVECLRNVLFINTLVDNIAEYFAGGEVSRIYINFCDPWPTNRHKKRRLTGRRFLEMYKLVLRPDGEIHFKTDNLPLFEFSLREFEDCGFEILETERDLHRSGPVGVMTDYELKFYSLGLPIYKCVARLK